MILYQNRWQWTPEDSATDAEFSFVCPPEIHRLHIAFSYAPGEEASETICRAPVEAAIARYYDRYSHAAEPMETAQFVPVKNLITLSLDHEGQYLGNAHRWAPQQEHRISVESASRGFLPPKEMAGRWRGMLHLHEILSPCCIGVIQIEGVE